MTASAVAQPGGGLDTLLGKLAPPRKQALLVSANSTWGSLPIVRAGQPLRQLEDAVDIGDDEPGHQPELARRAEDLQDRGPARVRLRGRAAEDQGHQLGRQIRGRSRSAWAGWPRFDPRWSRPTADDQLPRLVVGRAAGHDRAARAGPGRISIPALNRLHAAAADPDTQFSLACGQGPAITLDGHNYQDRGQRDARRPDRDVAGHGASCAPRARPSSSTAASTTCTSRRACSPPPT